MKDKLYKMMSWPQIEAIVYGEEGNPQTILGRHYVSAYTLYQTFIPSAESVELHIEGSKKKYAMELADESGFFAIAINGKETRDYYYQVNYSDGSSKILHDPYIFDCNLSKKEKASWNKGNCLDAYRLMGAHFVDINGYEGIVFRVWAPNAIRVSVIGDFNNWDGHAHPMIFDEESGVFSLFVPDIKDVVRYKYEICVKGGNCQTKLDPYAFEYDAYEDVCIARKSVDFEWHDEAFRKQIAHNEIVNILEIDNVFWSEGIDNLSFKSLDELCTYVNNSGYTHVYLNAGTSLMYCISDALKNNQSLKLLIDKFHSFNIGVIFDFNPCFFDNYENGLKYYDGTYLYGHLDEKKRYNAMFGCNYNYSRNQVRNYLYSNAMYWINEFHADGFHINDLSTVLYLNYGKSAEETAYNIYGGVENLDAIDFFREFNKIIHKEYAKALVTTKETCMFPNVTGKVNDDGLGFDYIFNNGFTEDLTEFIKDIGNIDKLTDSMNYAYSENYLLTINNEDVLVANDYDYERIGRGEGFFDNAAVEEDMKLSLKRALLSYIAAHPGKKLIALGQDEINISSKLNSLYSTLPAFYELDRYSDGFEWIRMINDNTGVIAFLRKSEVLPESILVVCNFSKQDYTSFKLGMPYEGKYKAFFNSEERVYGGDYILPVGNICTTDEEYDGKECTLTIPLPAMSVSYYTYSPYSESEFLKIAHRKAEKIRIELEKEAEMRAKELEKEALRKAKEYNNLNKKRK